METVDLSQLSQSELEAELKKRKKQQEDERQAYKDLIAEVVPGIVQNLSEISKNLSETKASVFDAFRDALDMKADVFGVKVGQQSHTFSHGDYSLTIGYRVNDGWDDTVNAGVAKVNRFIQSLAKNEESAAAVDGLTLLLKPDKQGNLKASRILELQKWASKHPHPDLADGVDIIVQSHKPVRSNWFIEAKMKNENGVLEPLPLSISTVDFPEGFDMNFLNANA